MLTLLNEIFNAKNNFSPEPIESWQNFLNSHSHSHSSLIVGEEQDNTTKKNEKFLRLKVENVEIRFVPIFGTLTLVFDKFADCRGDLYIASDMIYWYSEEKKIGFSLDYSSIILHSMTLNDIYIQMNGEKFVSAEGEEGSFHTNDFKQKKEELNNEKIKENKEESDEEGIKKNENDEYLDYLELHLKIVDQGEHLTKIYDAINDCWMINEPETDHEEDSSFCCNEDDDEENFSESNISKDDASQGEDEKGKENEEKEK